MTEVRAAVSAADHNDDLTDLEQLVRDWHVTAEALADPVSREVLLGAFDPDDYIEVSRPER